MTTRVILLALLALCGAAHGYRAGAPTRFVASSSTQRCATQMRYGKADVTRRGKLNALLDNVPDKDTFVANVLGPFSEKLLNKAGWVMRGRMIRKVKSRAAELGVTVPAGWGMAVSPTDHRRH